MSVYISLHGLFIYGVIDVDVIDVDIYAYAIVQPYSGRTRSIHSDSVTWQSDCGRACTRVCQSTATGM